MRHAVVTGIYNTDVLFCEFRLTSEEKPYPGESLLIQYDDIAHKWIGGNNLHPSVMLVLELLTAAGILARPEDG